MKFSPILIVAGEPNSIFFEIFLKAISTNRFKSPIILIGSRKLFNLQMNKLGFNKRFNILNINDLGKIKLDNKFINLIDTNYNTKVAFEKISKKSNIYIENSFKIAFKILKSGITKKFINGPISKKNFLGNNFLGITEYISNKFLVKKSAMLIYNKELSVCPVTTHLPIKQVSSQIKQKKIIEKIILINKFYKTNFKKKPKIGVLGLNPHCESIGKYKEDDRIIRPIIKKLIKKQIKISGPYSADTFFLKRNRINFDVAVGMYHDQVLAPLKTLFEYDAINITLGLPFIRISPDHGPNEKMLGKNLSNPLSMVKAIKFLDKN
jgi:4-hydroxythreonine-4-phosphate dehydrogenase